MREVVPAEVLSCRTGLRHIADGSVELARGLEDAAGVSVGCMFSMTSLMVTPGLAS